MEGKAFFRRFSFHGFDTQPKWHRLAEMKPGKLTYEDGRESKAIEVTALCGYKWNWVVALHGENGPLMWKDEVKTKKLRCSKCDAAVDPGTKD